MLAVHVTLKVALLLLSAAAGADASNSWQEVRGVVAAFVVFSPMMLLFGYIGGVSGRRAVE